MFEKSQAPNRNKSWWKTQWGKLSRVSGGASMLGGVPSSWQCPGILFGMGWGTRGMYGGDLGSLSPSLSLPYSPSLSSFLSLSLLEITNKPTHQRRIIKNNLHKLSVVWALFWYNISFRDYHWGHVPAIWKRAGLGASPIPEWLIKSRCPATRSRFEIPLQSPTMSSFFSSRSHQGQPEARVIIWDNIQLKRVCVSAEGGGGRGAAMCCWKKGNSREKSIIKRSTSPIFLYSVDSL